MQAPERHIPVMLSSVLDSLCPKKNGIYVDATFGFGGYTRAILEAADCKVIAIDRDPNVMPRAQELKKTYKDKFEFKQGCFSQIENLIDKPVDGVVFDIGVSSMQLDDAERGFSFSKEAPLDMRMSQSGTSAYDLVNNLSENELADILYLYGEEKKSRQIAKKIVEARAQKPIETTTELAKIIYTVIYKKTRQIDPATRSFQALRIAVNSELEELKEGLNGATNLLKPEGRLVVVDFHSLEDRIVKTFFKQNSAPKIHVSRYQNAEHPSNKAFEFVSKALLPTLEETNKNPRARSAKLRFGIKNKGEQND